MEEKKLTDEVIVKALECCIERQIDCEKCPLHDKYFPAMCMSILKRNSLALIHRLQSENAEWQKDYIALDLEARELRTELDKELAEHEEFTQKAKVEIERLTEDRNQLALCNKGLQDGINEYQADNAELGRKNAELQKQVDELMLIKGKYNDLSKKYMSSVKTADYIHHQAAKEVAREIISEIISLIKNAKDKLPQIFGNGSEYRKGYENSVEHFNECILKLAKNKGVEVE